MINREGALSKNIVQFCRFLRQKGFTLSVDEEATTLEGLEQIDHTSQPVFRLALKSLLCKRQHELQQFDDLFNKYWKEIGKAIDSKVKTKAEPVSKTVTKDASFKALKSWLNGHRNEQIEATATYSLNESLSQKDFTKIPDDELSELIQSIKALSKRLAAHLNRRYKNSRQVNRPDLRRTLRKNLRHGGELLEIVYKNPKRSRTKLVILCDVSKSMELYSSFLLQFMYAFQQVYDRIESFAFSTCLQRITPVLRQNDFGAALASLSGQVNTWSGGTRIGESLHQFIEEHASRVLDQRTIVVILSDGWDTGNISLVQQSMEKIKRKSKKLIWLNPLAGYSLYRPDVAGMQAAMPFVDVFASAHNVESFRKIVKWL